MKVGIYARISTDEQKQDVDRQTDTLKEYCHRRGWDYILLPPDRESAYKIKRARPRPSFNKLLKMARMREIDCVLVNTLDRFSREVPTRIFRYFDDLVRLSGCRFISLTEGIDSNNPMWEPMMASFAWMAHNYSKMLGASVKAGIERKKAQGKYHGGRPKKKIAKAEIRRIYQQVHSLRKTAKRYNQGRPKRKRISYPTVKKVLDNHYEEARP
jgi:DNA invertase Pin-like site-specific DNA recombinase